jgi:hypothetical protein
MKSGYGCSQYCQLEHFKSVAAKLYLLKSAVVGNITWEWRHFALQLGHVSCSEAISMQLREIQLRINAHLAVTAMQNSQFLYLGQSTRTPSTSRPQRSRANGISRSLPSVWTVNLIGTNFCLLSLAEVCHDGGSRRRECRPD